MGDAFSAFVWVAAYVLGCGIAFTAVVISARSSLTTATKRPNWLGAIVILAWPLIGVAAFALSVATLGTLIGGWVIVVPVLVVARILWVAAERGSKFKLGTTSFTVFRKPWRLLPKRFTGYARAAGIHFDVAEIEWLGVGVSSIQLRESDTKHPECIGGYLRSDVMANPSLVFPAPHTGEAND